MPSPEGLRANLRLLHPRGRHLFPGKGILSSQEKGELGCWVGLGHVDGAWVRAGSGPVKVPGGLFSSLLSSCTVLLLKETELDSQSLPPTPGD